MLAAQGSLMAIDLGSEYLKVCLVKPGRTPISIVVNEMSRRKSPALVGIVEEERVLGEEAFSLGIRCPNVIFSQLRNLLGRSAGDAEVQRLVQQNLLPYTVVDHPQRGTAALQINETTLYLVEELVVSGTKAQSTCCSSRQYTAAVANSGIGCSRCCSPMYSIARTWCNDACPPSQPATSQLASIKQQSVVLLQPSPMGRSASLQLLMTFCRCLHVPGMLLINLNVSCNSICCRATSCMEPARSCQHLQDSKALLKHTVSLCYTCLPSIPFRRLSLPHWPTSKVPDLSR
jgi:hypothetical protein